MADNNPFLEFLASQQGQDDGAQPPLAPLSPQERDLLGSGGGTALSQPPDTSNLPVSSKGDPGQSSTT